MTPETCKSDFAVNKYLHTVPSGWIFINNKGFFSPLKHPDLFRDPPSLLALMPGLKRQGREADYSHPSNIEVKNEWRYSSTPILCFSGVYTDNSTVNHPL